jgi:hypothetical protein
MLADAMAALRTNEHESSFARSSCSGERGQVLKELKEVVPGTFFFAHSVSTDGALAQLRAAVGGPERGRRFSSFRKSPSEKGIGRPKSPSIPRGPET